MKKSKEIERNRRLTFEYYFRERIKRTSTDGNTCSINELTLLDMMDLNRLEESSFSSSFSSFDDMLFECLSLSV